MNILSIQSHVAYGHVGNAAAVFPLQRMGVEVWPIHTVQFSNHTGYGSWKGRVFDAGMISEVAVLVTSLHTDETPKDSIDPLASNEGACFILRTPKLPLAVNGASDAIAALFFAHYLSSGDIGDALSRAASSVFGVLAKTAGIGASEIQLVAAQDEIASPSRLFEAKALRS